ncbi:aldehyde dehydrogenase family protein [Streptomyces tubercidicus]|uniref:aldehyde dehydrogenase family protein n=1 Tax=Streptomyces tubercidicus TaxID=47759 RepID=UPI002E131AC7|nr:aldehyde dehydrogenase family protein [Streptomyces tubercidicus]
MSRLPDHAEVVTGGTAPVRAGWFHSPTVVAGVRQGDEIAQEEIFGPVVTPVQPSTDEDEALRLANGVRFGWRRASGPTTTRAPCTPGSSG